MELVLVSLGRRACLDCGVQGFDVSEMLLNFFFRREFCEYEGFINFWVGSVVVFVEDLVIIDEVDPFVEHFRGLRNGKIRTRGLTGAALEFIGIVWIRHFI